LVLTKTGKVELEIPRDRLSTFDPQLIAKYQRRLSGYGENIISTYARHEATKPDDRTLTERGAPAIEATWAET
jgi:transposase-like protein